MIKQVIDTKYPIMIYNPTGTTDIEYFNSVKDTGSLPVFDTEFIEDNEIIEFITECEKKQILFAIRINVKRKNILDNISASFYKYLNSVVLSYDLPDDLSLYHQYLAKIKYKVFIETMDILPAEFLSEIGPEALIVKGNEGSGRVSQFSTFVLMQWYVEQDSYPVFAQGGVGFHTGSGFFAAGASGVVLDSQLLLTDESPASEKYRNMLIKIEEKDSVKAGQSLKRRYRFFTKLATKITKELKQKESEFLTESDSDDLLYDWISENISFVDNNSQDPVQSLLYLGQDAVFAKHFVEETTKLKEVIENFMQTISQSLRITEKYNQMKKNSPVAKEHGTAYPIMQGPMANISDKADFAKALNDGGALPFMAMGSLPEELAEKMLSETNQKAKSWGAGMIGFSGINKMIDKHIEIVKKFKPEFALFAGGTPSQAKELENEGIKTYLHTPAPSMVENGIKNNCTRFIFEGHEAGGHVGALTSMVLWEMSIHNILKKYSDKVENLNLIFAGGIASTCGINFIAGMTSKLSKAGAKIGIQVGTAYLFTEDIVKYGAINDVYQNLICSAESTIVAGETIGLSTRTLGTDFTRKMIEREHERVRNGMPLQERKHEFEKDNFGALLIGAKGFCPEFNENGEVSLKHFDDKEQIRKGNYMCGEALIFNDCRVTIESIHKRLFENESVLSENLNALEIFTSEDNSINDEIAIIGLGCVYPDADNPIDYWKNILSKKYSIREFNKFNFKEFYFSSDRKAEDKAYSGIAGQADNFKFDAKKFGYNENEASEISPSQKMILEAAFQAVASSGYYFSDEQKRFPASKTSVIIGSCLSNPYTDELILKQYYPEFKYYLENMKEFQDLSDDEKNIILNHLKEKLKDGKNPKYPTGAAINVESARISAHLGLEGVNYTVDAACATSFTAVDNAVKELLGGSSDVALAGGVNTNLAPETFVGFCKMGALSADGSFPFDKRAGGFVLGEGAGVVVLKRMRDALRDGDNIHAVIKGVGASTDGKGKAIAAPQLRGQMLAIERCYENCRDKNFTKEKIDYVEAHGTSTLMGDKTEIETINEFYGNNPNRMGVSSAKALIGHLLGGAGAAGLIKAVLAIENKTLPPNGDFQELSNRFDISDSSVYIIEEAKEWETQNSEPRRAAVSSYGFGGINYHIGIEEFNSNYKPLPRNIFFDKRLCVDDDRIVIAGVGVVTPGALNSAEFWDVIESGKNQYSKIPEERFHNSAFVNEDREFALPMVNAGIIRNYKFNNVKFRIPPAATKSIDRAQLLALEMADEAIKNSNISEILKDKKNKVGVIIGTSTGEMHNENTIRTRMPFLENILLTVEGVDQSKKENITKVFSETLKKRYYKNTEDSVPGLLSNIVPGRIANFFNCNGPSYIVEAECASSAIAINAALKELRQKKSDVVLCGGVDANLSPSSLMAYYLIKVLSDKEGSFFDKNSRGLVMGEGGALLALTTYKFAKENNMPVMAEISEMDFQSYAKDNILSPTVSSFNKVINRTHQKSSVSKNKIDYIDVFASSNKIVDKWELEVLENNFNRNVYFGNSKSQISYFRAANPAVVLSKLALMTQNNAVTVNTGYNPDSSMIKPDMKLKAAEDTIILDKNSENYFSANFAGLGGNTGYAIVKTFPKRLSSPESEIDNDSMISSGNDQKIINTVLMFSGQGSQYPGMMKELYDNIPEIKLSMDSADDVFKKERGYSLLDLMFGSDAAVLNKTENTQPAVFLSSAVLFDYLKKKGLSYNALTGHSLGELSALYAAGVFSLKEGMKLVIKRSSLMKEAGEKIKGSIMVVFKSGSETADLIKKSTLSDIYIANKNSDSQTAVSGTDKGIDGFCSFLKENKVSYKKLQLSGAFHSPLFQEASEEFRNYLGNINFNTENIDIVKANLNAEFYPKSEKEAKDILAKQIVSTVEFVKIIENFSKNGASSFIEIGPGNILTGLHSKISSASGKAFASVTKKESALKTLSKIESDFCKSSSAKTIDVKPQRLSPAKPGVNIETEDLEYKEFLNSKKSQIDEILYKEFQKQKKEKALNAIDNMGIYTGSIVIPGVAAGLPGKSGKVFDDDNIRKLLRGNNFIDSLTKEEQEKIITKNITRVFKDPDGNAKFVEIKDNDHIVHLAGQLGYFDLKEYGVDYEYDITYGLAVAAGIEALKDANIPLVMQYKKTSSGSMLPDGYALPKQYQNSTGVIFTSLFPGFETFIREVSAYYADKFSRRPFEEFEKIYFFLMEKVKDPEIKQAVTDWYVNIKKDSSVEKYQFNRNLLTQIISLGSGHFAQIIKAKGPNTMISGACASATQAVGVAEDWIRTGRCKRVILVGGEAATSEVQNEWISSGFLALGAASVKRSVSEAAKPFDIDRNGMIVGSGAYGLVVERKDSALERGFNGQAEILGTYIGNSAFHVSKINVEHLSEEMNMFFSKMEKLYSISRNDISSKMLFMSHETYTPARGGSADAEVSAIKNAFPESYKNITITNIKGYTGHGLGAGIEDAVMVKALQYNEAPAIANLKKIPDHFRDLKFSKGGSVDCEYGFHLAAGFGSHFAFLFVKKINENPVSQNSSYYEWLKKISGENSPELIEKNKTLCIKSSGPSEKKSEDIPVQSSSPIEKKTVVFDPAKIKSIIAEQTGYEELMLEEDLDLEADLGIDTVKQVEIFGEVAAHYGLEVPEDLQLSELNTISKLASYVGSKLGGAVSSNDEGSVPGGSTPFDLAKIKSIIAEQTGYEELMLEEDLDLEADLGIDTVKQVEIFGEVAAHYGLEVPEDLQLSELNTISKLASYVGSKLGGAVSSNDEGSVPGGSTPFDPAKIKSIIAEQTGYEESMLEEDLDLEADLGIDTVKQVEIFGEVAAHYGLEVPEDLQLSELNTISKLASYVGSKLGGAVSSNDEGSVPGGSTPFDPAKIKSIIAEQTGYEESMLEEDLDLEADLGIDTVKQVEIFGEVAAHYGLEVPEDLQLSELNTISKLASYVASATGGLKSSEINVVSDSSEIKGKDQDNINSSVKRLVMFTEKSPLKKNSSFDFTNKNIFITVDSHGFFENIKQFLEGKGASVFSIGSENCAVNIDLTKVYDSEKEILKYFPENKTVDGLILLTGLDYYPKTSKYSDKELNSVIKNTFLLIKTQFENLSKKGSIIAAPSLNSVVFPYSNTCGKIYPLFAGLSGMLKTVAKEMSDSFVKIVDFKTDNFRSCIDDISETFIEEIASGEKHVECGYDGKERYVVKIKDEPVTTNEPFIKSGSTVLVSGGARGITYEIVKGVVEQYKTNIIILGRSDIYSLDKEFLENNYSEKDIISKIKESMPNAKPIDLKKGAQRIIRFRESAENIEKLKSLGVDVNYHAVDVTNSVDVSKVLKKYQMIDGVIHAAGVEESQFLMKKDLSSFNRVFDTKIIGMKNILNALKGRELNFVTAFSSVTARFGNEGQIDYTSANDMLGKMLQSEKQKNPDTVYKTYDWTAWSGTGMATNPTVKKVLESRGITFLPVKEGVAFFLDDIKDPHRDEVLISGIDHDFDPDGMLPGKTDKKNTDVLDLFLDKIKEENGNKTVFSRQLNLKRDIFLKDHALHDVPIFLGATGIEMMAEAVKHASSSNQKICSLTEFEIPYGIKILKGKPKDLIIEADSEGTAFIKSVFVNPKGKVMGSPKIHYKGKYNFSDNYSESDTALPEFKEISNSVEAADLMYHPERLFMGGVFDSVEKVMSFDGKNLITLISDTSNEEFFAGMQSPGFDLDVVLLDGMFQTGGMVEFLSTDNMVLPYRIREMKICGDTNKNQKYLCRTERVEETESTVVFNVTLFEENGKVIYDIRDFEMVKISKLKEGYRIKGQIKF